MPLLQSAIKKMRQDKKKKAINSTYKRAYKKSLKELEKAKTPADKAKKISASYARIDKAAKKGIMHKNKAARLKSKIAKAPKKVNQ